MEVSYMRPQEASIQNFRCKTSFVVPRGSAEHLYCGYLEYRGFFREANTYCFFEEHDPRILEPTTLPPIKISLYQNSSGLAHQVPWLTPYPWTHRTPNLTFEQLRDVSAPSATIWGALIDGRCDHLVQSGYLHGADAAEAHQHLQGYAHNKSLGVNARGEITWPETVQEQERPIPLPYPYARTSYDSEALRNQGGSRRQ